MIIQIDDDNYVVGVSESNTYTKGTIAEVTDSRRYRVGDLITSWSGLNVLMQSAIGSVYLHCARRKQKERINARCRQEIERGFTSSALGADHHYEFKEHDQSNLQATFMLAKETSQPRVFKCRDSNGIEEYRLHSVSDLMQVGMDAEQHKMSALVKAFQLRQMIDSSEAVSDVQNIDWDTALPE